MREMIHKPPRFLLRVSVILLATIPFLTTGLAPRHEVDSDVAADTEGIQTPTGTATRGAELVHLPPGTRFRHDAPPPGWSEVVFKSTPVLASGALDTLSPEAHETARRIRLAILVDVTGPPGAERLRRVGIGLTAPVVGEGPDAGDVVVAATNVGEASGEWSTKERLILAAGSRELARASLAASTPSFALLRTPTTCLVGRDHETVDVLYALLLDRPSGRLRFFACKPVGDGSGTIIRELKAPAIVEGPLHVKAKTFAGYPVSWSFAMTDIPAGDEREVPSDLTGRLHPARLDSNEPSASELENAFRSFARRPAITPTARATPAVQRD